MQRRKLQTPDDALALLAELGAPARLVRHGRLVLEAAEELLVQMNALGLVVDATLVRSGAVLHDAGKALHPSELDAPGARHEEAGEQLLLARGVEPAIARCCVSHAQWALLPCSLEELLVALADALWKGVRRDALEKRVVEECARRLGVDTWSIFVGLDSCFEAIADRGAERIARSLQPEAGATAGQSL
jgi:HD superfamily phosphodiesterase